MLLLPENVWASIQGFRNHLLSGGMSGGRSHVDPWRGDSWGTKTSSRCTQSPKIWFRNQLSWATPWFSNLSHHLYLTNQCTEIVKSCAALKCCLQHEILHSVLPESHRDLCVPVMLKASRMVKNAGFPQLRTQASLPCSLCSPQVYLIKYK